MVPTGPILLLCTIWQRNIKAENQGQPWSPELDRCLLDLHQKGVPVNEIAVTLKRGSGAVRSRLKKLGITES